MILNVANFQRLIKKGTYGYLMDNIQFKISEKSIFSSTMDNNKEASAVLNIENDCIYDVESNFKLYFTSPYMNLLPFLNILDSKEVVLKLHEDKIIIIDGKMRSNIFFCDESIISIFDEDRVKQNMSEGDTGVEKISSFIYDKIFETNCKKILKIGPTFEKVYVGFDHNKIYIETCDKTNPASNGFRFYLNDITVDNKLNGISLFFSFQTFSKLISIITSKEDFNIDVYYSEFKNMGLLIVSNEKERYYMMSRSE